MNIKSYIDISVQLRNALNAAYPNLDIDIYNGQYEDPEKFASYNYPAVFIEFSPNNWQVTTDDSYEGPGGFKIHCVVPLVDQDTRNIDKVPAEYQLDKLKMMAFPMLVHDALTPPSPNRFIPTGFRTPLELAADEPDHNYSQVYCMVLHYRAIALDTSSNYINGNDWETGQITKVVVVPEV